MSLEQSLERVEKSLDRFRKSEYTGENRCLPCTVVNLVIALIAAVTTVGALTMIGISPLPSLLAGILLLAGCVVTVSLRGYLIPGTPTMTKRYMPRWLLRLFDKDPEPRRDGTGNMDIETVLLEAGILEECVDRSDLCLTPSFETDWHSRIDALLDADPGIEPLLERSELEGDGDGREVAFKTRDGAYVASVDDIRIAQWPSRAAFLADMAAATEIRNRYPGWRGMTFLERTELAGSLRLWLEQCPVCEGIVAMGQETVSSCCRERQVLASNCEACESRLFETDVSAVSLELD